MHVPCPIQEQLIDSKSFIHKSSSLTQPVPDSASVFSAKLSTDSSAASCIETFFFFFFLVGSKGASCKEEIH